MLRLRLNSRLEYKVRDLIWPLEPYREHVTVSNEGDKSTFKVITNFKSPHTILVLMHPSNQVIVYKILYRRSRVAQSLSPSARKQRYLAYKPDVRSRCDARSPEQRDMSK